MRYHNITKDDMLNGDGLRAVLWVAGCSHGENRGEQAAARAQAAARLRALSEELETLAGNL